MPAWRATVGYKWRSRSVAGIVLYGFSRDLLTDYDTKTRAVGDNPARSTSKGSFDLHQFGSRLPEPLGIFVILGLRVGTRQLFFVKIATRDSSIFVPRRQSHDPTRP